MYLLAKKLGFADEMFKNIKVENNLPVAEDILREINRGSWTTGYCGQSPERLKAHMKNQAKFDLMTHARAEGRSGSRRRLLRPAVAVLGHAGGQASGHAAPLQHQLAVMDGGGTFRAHFGVEREEKLPDGTTRKVNLLADGSYSKDSRDQGRLSRVHLRRAEEARLGQDLTEPNWRRSRRSTGDNAGRVSWSTDLSGGIQRVAHEARLRALRQRQGAHECVRNCPDPIPVHREPIYTPRVDLVAKYPTCPTPSSSGCRTSASRCRRPRSTRASPRSSR